MSTTIDPVVLQQLVAQPYGSYKKKDRRQQHRLFRQYMMNTVSLRPWPMLSSIGCGSAYAALPVAVTAAAVDRRHPPDLPGQDQYADDVAHGRRRNSHWPL